MLQYCNAVLSLQKTVSETRVGLHSILNVSCDKFNIKNTVHIGKMSQSGNTKHSEINLEAVLDKFSLTQKIFNIS